MADLIHGDRYALASLETSARDYGPRKIRDAIRVTAFGFNALVLPPGHESGVRYHDEQEDTCFVHQGEVEFRFGNGSPHLLRPGGLAASMPLPTAGCATPAMGTRSSWPPGVGTATSGATGVRLATVRTVGRSARPEPALSPTGSEADGLSTNVNG